MQKKKKHTIILTTVAALSLGVTGFMIPASIFADENETRGYMYFLDNKYSNIEFKGNQEEIFGQDLWEDEKKQAYNFLTDGNLLQLNTLASTLKSLHAVDQQNNQVIYSSEGYLFNNTDTEQEFKTPGMNTSQADTISTTSKFSYNFEQTLQMGVETTSSLPIMAAVKTEIKNTISNAKETTDTYMTTNTINIPEQTIKVPPRKRYQIRATVSQLNASGTMSEISEVTFNRNEKAPPVWRFLINNFGDFTGKVEFTNSNGTSIGNNLHNASPYEFFKHLQATYNEIKNSPEEYGSVSDYKLIIKMLAPTDEFTGAVTEAMTKIWGENATEVMSFEYVMKNIFFDEKLKKVYRTRKDIPFKAGFGLSFSVDLYDVTDSKSGELVKNIDKR